MNYDSTSRTNYFKVTDEEKFYKLINRIPKVVIWKDGNSFAFGLKGVVDEVFKGKDELIDIVVELQEILNPEDTIVILEVGTSGLDVRAECGVVTKDDIKWVDFLELVKEKFITNKIRF